MSIPTINSVSWAQKQRLKFIERQLLWGRAFKARMLIDNYGISRHQANKDIKLYIEIFPGNLKPYNPADKSHRPTTGFKPKLISEDPVEVVHAGGFGKIEGTEVGTLSLLHRRIIDGVTPTILASIENKSDIEVVYASSTTPVGRRRRLHPKVMIFAGNRLHIRAYCYENKDYRDFVLSRILTKPKQLKTEILPIDDEDYSLQVEIKLLANPALSKEGRDLIRREYSLIEDTPVLVRKCLMQYFLQANALPASKIQLEESEKNPWSFPVVSNYKDFW